MAFVVFTTIENLADLATAKWTPGDNESYANTKRMIPDNGRQIQLIGRQDKYGRVQLCYAKSNQQDWAVVGAYHCVLAEYFFKKLDETSENWDGREFFTEIDDEKAAAAAQSLIAVECGVNVTKERSGKLHLAVLHVQRGLRALGLPCADWTFVPMFNSFKTPNPKTPE
mgnify:FL=1